MAADIEAAFRNYSHLVQRAALEGMTKTIRKQMIAIVQTVDAENKARFRKERERSLEYANIFRARQETIRKRQIANDQVYALGLSMQSIIKSAQVAAAEGPAQRFGIIGRVYRESVDRKWIQIAKINREVANGAIEAMEDKYLERHDFGLHPAPYRLNQREAGGKLLKAIHNPAQALASIDGVNFLNTTLFDQEARQWARLNFGAGPRAAGGPALQGPVPVAANRFNVSNEFFKAAVGAELPSFTAALPFTAREAWVLPGGFFIQPGQGFGGIQSHGANPNGTDSFFLYKDVAGGIDKSSASANVKRAYKSIGRQHRIQTEGTAPYGFLEAGVQYLAANLPRANAAFMLQIFEEARLELETTGANRINVDAENLALISDMMGKAKLNSRRRELYRNFVAAD